MVLLVFLVVAAGAMVLAYRMPQGPLYTVVTATLHTSGQFAIRVMFLIIAALVVAEGLDEAGIVDALRSSIDTAFLPRRVRRVAALPRNDCGKLPRDALLRMLQADGA